MLFKLRVVLVFIGLLVPTSVAWSKTSDVSSASFVSSFHEELAATPEQAWEALVHVAGWWSSEHTYSGDARNLSLDAQAGGCWCERWAGNSVQHARVLVAMPGRMLRVEGGLGPLQPLGVTGILVFRLTPGGDGAVLDVTYRVRATPDAALDKLAAAVDGVIAEQVKRLVGSLAKESPTAPTKFK